MRALLVEDDVRIARKVTDALASAGYASPSGSGRSAPLAVTHPERQPLGDHEGVARHALGEQAQIRHPPRFRQRSGEVTFGGRLIDRLLSRCQPPGQRHVKEPGAKHVRIAPADQQRVVLGRQPPGAAACQFRLGQRRAKPVELLDAGIRQRLQRRAGRRLAQRQEPMQIRDMQRRQIVTLRGSILTVTNRSALEACAGL